MTLRTEERREAGADQREAWCSLATRCAAQIRKQCGRTLDAATERRIVRVFRAVLRPRMKAGRKPDRETVRAAELWLRYSSKATQRPLLKRQQRKLWQRIYREVFADFGRLDKLTRQYRTSLLRRNVKADLNRKACN